MPTPTATHKPLPKETLVIDPAVGEVGDDQVPVPPVVLVRILPRLPTATNLPSKNFISIIAPLPVAVIARIVDMIQVGLLK